MKDKRDILKAGAVSLVALAISIAYLVLIGIPMTQARNYFNDGLRSYQMGDYSKANQYFRQSLQSWETPEARAYLGKTQ